MSDIKTDPKTYLRRAVILKKTHSTSKPFLPVVAPNIHPKKKYTLADPLLSLRRRRGITKMMLTIGPPGPDCPRAGHGSPQR